MEKINLNRIGKILITSVLGIFSALGFYLAYQSNLADKPNTGNELRGLNGLILEIISSLVFLLFIFCVAKFDPLNIQQTSPLYRWKKIINFALVCSLVAILILLFIISQG